MIQLRDWLGAARQRKRLLLRPPYTLASRDLLHTGVASGSLDVLSCLSVIEHGIDLAAFFSEAARMLRVGGRLYVSTDYWEPKLDTSHRRMFGLPWTVFDAEELTAIAALAVTHGLQTTIPDPTELQVGCRSSGTGSLSTLSPLCGLKGRLTFTPSTRSQRTALHSPAKCSLSESKVDRLRQSSTPDPRRMTSAHKPLRRYRASDALPPEG